MIFSDSEIQNGMAKKHQSTYIDEIISKEPKIYKAFMNVLIFNL